MDNYIIGKCRICEMFTTLKNGLCIRCEKKGKNLFTEGNPFEDLFGSFFKNKENKNDNQKDKAF